MKNVIWDDCPGLEISTLKQFFLHKIQFFKRFTPIVKNVVPSLPTLIVCLQLVCHSRIFHSQLVTYLEMQTIEFHAFFTLLNFFLHH